MGFDRYAGGSPDADSVSYYHRCSDRDHAGHGWRYEDGRKLHLHFSGRQLVKNTSVQPHSTMKTLRLLALLAVTSLACLAPVRAGTGDFHFSLTGTNGQLNELVLAAPTSAGALYQDGNGNWSFAPLPTIPTNIPVLTNGDFTVTVAGLTTGTGTLASKFTMPLTFPTPFASGVIPTVWINTHGLCTYADAINITNTGCTVVLPISVGGTFTVVAFKKQ